MVEFNQFYEGICPPVKNTSNHCHIIPCLGLKPVEEMNKAGFAKGRELKGNPTANMQQRKIKNLL